MRSILRSHMKVVRIVQKRIMDDVRKNGLVGGFHLLLLYSVGEHDLQRRPNGSHA